MICDFYLRRHHRGHLWSGKIFSGGKENPKTHPQKTRMGHPLVGLRPWEEARV